MIFKSMGKNSLLLAVFALVTAVILASTDRLTEDRIAESERLAAQKALFEIIPLERHNNDLLLDTQPIPEQYWQPLGLSSGGDIHIARLDGQPVAAIIPSITPEGYSGDIAMIVGVNFDGTIAGVRVVEHKETPGLGDKVDLQKVIGFLALMENPLAIPSQAHGMLKKRKGILISLLVQLLHLERLFIKLLKPLNTLAKIKNAYSMNLIARIIS